MNSLKVPMNMDEKIDIEFNAYNQPVGESVHLMQRLIGDLVKKNVKITFTSWKIVPMDVKLSIWESVNLYFNVRKDWKKGCLASACDKWRQFKSKLTSHVYKMMNTQELYTPPLEYEIQEDDWKDFVTIRLTEEFKKSREEHKKLRSKNTLPYRFSSKGYARYAHENKALLCDDAEINQAILWVEGRKSKADIHEGDELKQKVDVIKELVSKKKSRTLDLELGGKRSTILEIALGNDERPGHLRAVGNHVCQTTYFKVPRGRKSYMEHCSQQQCELLEKKKKNDELEARLAKVEAAVFKRDDDSDLQMLDDNAQSVKPHTFKRSVGNLKIDWSGLPVPLYMVYCCCKEKPIQIGVNLIRDCGIKCTLFINPEDVEHFCLLKPISYMCIGVYIWVLYKKLVEMNKVNKFIIADPYLLENSFSKEQRAKELASFLCGCSADQIALVPCNVGKHWILTVIDPHKEVSYVLDSLFDGDYDWEQVVALALKWFIEEKQRPQTKAPVWMAIQCPRQPTNSECGYYTMRFMRDIVHSTTFDSIGSLQSLFNNKIYSNEDIDEVRREWAVTVQDFIYKNECKQFIARDKDDVKSVHSLSVLTDSPLGDDENTITPFAAPYICPQSGDIQVTMLDNQVRMPTNTITEEKQNLLPSSPSTVKLLLLANTVLHGTESDEGECVPNETLACSLQKNEDNIDDMSSIPARQEPAMKNFSIDESPTGEKNQISSDSSAQKLVQNTLSDSCKNLFTSPTNEVSRGAQNQVTKLLMTEHATDGTQNGRQVSTHRVKRKRSKSPIRERSLASILENSKHRPNSPSRMGTMSKPEQNIEILDNPLTCLEALAADTRSTVPTKNLFLHPTTRASHMNAPPKMILDAVLRRRASRSVPPRPTEF